jgi:hypothetical protein
MVGKYQFLEYAHGKRILIELETGELAEEVDFSYLVKTKIKPSESGDGLLAKLNKGGETKICGITGMSEVDEQIHEVK